MFSKSYIIPSLEITLDYTALNYCLLDITCFPYAKDNFISHQLAWQKADCSKHHCTTEPISRKKCVSIHCEEKTPGSRPIWHNCCKETSVDGRVFVMVWGAKSGICSRWRANWIRSAIKTYCGITRSYVERGLLSKDLLLMQDNDPNHTNKLCQKYIENKEEQYILQLMSWPAQSVDLHLIVSVWDELDKMSDLNKPQVWLTSGNCCRKAGQNYI